MANEYKFEEIGGGSDGGGSVELDTTLTQAGKAADAAEVGRRFTTAAGERAALGMRILSLEQGGGGGGVGAEIYIVNNTMCLTVEEMLYANEGMNVTVNTQIVETLPDTLTLSTFADGGNIYLYIVESTGIVYGDLGAGAMTLGLGFFQGEGYDKGWSANIGGETANGVYCVRTVRNLDGGRQILTIVGVSENGGGGITLSKAVGNAIKNNFLNTVLHIYLENGTQVVLTPFGCGGLDYMYSALVSWLGVPQCYRGWARDDGTGTVGFSLNIDDFN